MIFPAGKDFRKDRRGCYFSCRTVAVIVALVAILLLAACLVFRSRDEGAVLDVPAQTLRLPAAESRPEWSRPEEGWLGGRVTGIDAQGFVLESFDKKFWYVKMGEGTPGAEVVEFTAKLRVDGSVINEGTFEATSVSAWVTPME